MANKCLINVRNIRRSGKLGELHPSVSTEFDCCKNYFASIALGADWMATCQINRLISSSSFCLAPIYYFNKLGLFTLNRAELFSLAAINQWAGKSSSIQQPADLHPAWHRAFDAFPWSVRSVSQPVWWYGRALQTTSCLDRPTHGSSPKSMNRLSFQLAAKRRRKCRSKNRGLSLWKENLYLPSCMVRVRLGRVWVRIKCQLKWTSDRPLNHMMVSRRRFLTGKAKVSCCSKFH